MFAFHSYNQIIQMLFKAVINNMGDIFNENLKSAREKKGLSQKEVAEAIGVAKSTYSLYESGNREPNVQTIKRIADV